jgi:hypothetical protein
MSILGLLFGSSSSDDDLYSDTNTEGDTDAYMYRLEPDGSTTPVSQEEYREATKDDWTSGYYDDVPLDDDDVQASNPWWVGLGCVLPSSDDDDDDDTPKKGLFGLW